MDGWVKENEMDYIFEVETQKGKKREDISPSSNKTVKLPKLAFI